MIDKSGNLYKVDKDGTKTKLGDDYGETSILTTLNGKLWTVEGGSLYRTSKQLALPQKPGCAEGSP